MGYNKIGKLFNDGKIWIQTFCYVHYETVFLTLTIINLATK